MNKAVEEFYNSVPENHKEIVAKLSQTILKSNNKLSEDIKWKKLTFGFDNDFYHWICQINCTKKSVVLYFHFGRLLEDKYNVLIIGQSKFLRKIEFKSLKDIDEIIINDYLSQAINKLDYFKDNWKDLIKKQE